MGEMTPQIEGRLSIAADDHEFMLCVGQTPTTLEFPDLQTAWRLRYRLTDVLRHVPIPEILRWLEIDKVPIRICVRNRTVAEVMLQHRSGELSTPVKMRPLNILAALLRL